MHPMPALPRTLLTTAQFASVQFTPVQWSQVTAGLFFLLFLLLSTPAISSPENDLEAHLLNRWEPVSNQGGIHVYRRHTDDSRIKTFRGVTQIQTRNPSSLIAAFADISVLPEWAHLVSEARQLDDVSLESGAPRLVQVIAKVPWPLKDREAIVKAHLQSQKGFVKLSLENAPDALPPNPRLVRFPAFNGQISFRKLEADRVEVIYEAIADPGGYIPSWLVNMLMKDAARITLERLPRIATRAKYQSFRWPDLE